MLIDRVKTLSRMKNLYFNLSNPSAIFCLGRVICILLSSGILFPIQAQRNIQTFAGGASADGVLPGKINMLPSGIVISSEGVVYISDRHNHRILKIDPGTGRMKLVAGNGKAGFGGDGGPALQASISAPEGLALDKDGNLYIADKLNHRIRKVNVQTGYISTLVGDGNPGFFGQNSPAIEAQLNSPSDVAVDDAGNLYIADTYNNRIRKYIVATGQIITVAGSGTPMYSGDGELAIMAGLRAPTGIDVDKNGNLYIADALNDRIRRVDAESRLIFTIAGNSDSGFNGDERPGAEASLQSPRDVVIAPNGDIFITDSWNSRIRRVDAETGYISTIAGSGESGYGGDGGNPLNARVQMPTRIALGPSGSLFLADEESYRIRKINASFGLIEALAGNGFPGFSGENVAAQQSTLYSPERITQDAQGNIYISDEFNHRIRKIDAQTKVITTIVGNGRAGFSGDGGLATEAQLNHPEGISVDLEGNIYIADKYNHRIRKVSQATGIISTFAGNGVPTYNGDNMQATNASLKLPLGVTTDPTGNVYIADALNHRIRRVNTAGIISTIAGDGFPGYRGDNSLALLARFVYPTEVVYHEEQNVLFVSDMGNHRIRRIGLSSRIITTIAGNGQEGARGDQGPANQASLSNPFGLAIDQDNNLYISDADNHRIRRVNLNTGRISTAAGQGDAGFTGDRGPARQAALNFPTGVAFDQEGNIYIADQDNDRIRQLYRPCSFTEITATNNQTSCDIKTNMYSQELIIGYTNPPANSLLEVNGQRFPITGSPQRIILDSLQADGQAVDIQVQFTTDGFCAITQTNVFTAPERCLVVPEITNFSIIDANTEVAIPGYKTVSESVILDLAAMPLAFNIQANISPEIVGSVAMRLIKPDGSANELIKNTAPYYLFEQAWDLGSPMEGEVYRLIVTPYWGENKEGLAGVSDTLNFSFVNVPRVRGLALVDIDGQRIPGYELIQEGDTIDLAKIPLGFNVRVLTNPRELGSLAWELEVPNADNLANVDNFANYKLFEECWSLDIPNESTVYTLRATPFWEKDAKGERGETQVTRFSFKNIPEVLGFTLINLENNQPVSGYENINENSILDLNVLPPDFIIQANTNSQQLGSILLEITDSEGNTYSEIQTEAPYQLFQGVWPSQGLEEGKTYTLKATPYWKSDTSGIKGRSKILQVRFSNIPQIQSFSIIDMDTEQPVPGYGTLEDGTVIDIMDLPLRFNISVNIQSGKVGSVFSQFGIPGRDNVQIADMEAPYYIFEDTWDLGTPSDDGTYTLEAVPFLGTNSNGLRGPAKAIRFSFENIPTIKSFTLIDTRTDLPAVGHELITDNDTLDLLEIPRNFSFQVDTEPAEVGSIEIKLSGSLAEEVNRIEDEAPYTVFQDFGGDYFPMSYDDIFLNQVYVLEARAYNQRDAQGISGEASVVRFVFIYEGEVLGLSLIDTRTGEIIPGYELMNDRTEINLANTNIDLNFLSLVVQTSPNDAGSVKTELVGQNTTHIETENAPPYAVFGNRAGPIFNKWKPAAPQVGESYEANIYLHSKKNQLGFEKGPFTIRFSFIEEQTINNFQVYPNPSSESISFAHLSGANKAKVSIYNKLGTLVLTQQLDGEYGEAIDVSQLSSGMYLVKIEMEDRVVSRTILIQN